MTRTVISTYFSEEDINMLRAEVFEENNMFGIQYLKGGTVFHEERFPGKSIHYVEDAAENWALGIKLI
jgi:hypothetical protein